MPPFSSDIRFPSYFGHKLYPDNLVLLFKFTCKINRLPIDSAQVKSQRNVFLILYQMYMPA